MQGASVAHIRALSDNRQLSVKGVCRLMEAIRRYLAEAGDRATVEMVNYISSLSLVRRDSPEVASRIVKELEDQRCSNLKLIASENFSSLSVQAAMANLLTDKYAEGYPYHRFYAGCDNIDAVEALAVEKAKELFGAEHAYVQPHSGADANLCAYWAILNQRVQVPTLEEMGITNPSELTRDDWNRIREACHNQRLLGLDYYSGGHLTHGYRQNVSAQMFDAYSYTVDEKTSLLDYDAIEALGATAQAVDFSELFTALQSGIVDGAEQPLSGYVTNAYPEIAKYYVLDQHEISPNLILFSEVVWNRLSEEDKALIQECFNESVPYFEEISDAADAEYLQQTIDAGVTVTEVDVAEWKEACASVYDAYGDEYADIIAQIEAAR